jgi:signal transduction histidine kinase/DNA-binding NarL/FixJ family response regulator
MRKKILTQLIIISLLGVVLTLAAAYVLMTTARSDINLDRSDPFNDPYILIYLAFYVLMAVANIAIVLFIVNKSIIKGIQETVKVLKRYTDGETDSTADVRSCKEFTELSDSINLMFDNTEKQIAEILALKTHMEMSNRAKSAFFAAVSHEIRTPMNAIIGMSGLIADENMSAEQLDRIQSMQTYSDILLGIVDDLLDLSRIEEGDFTLTPVHYNFPVLLDNIVSAARLPAREKGLELSVDFAVDLPEYIYGDAARLRQALNNLLSNAVKFTEKGGVKFSVRPVNVPEEIIEICIIDTGAGISPQDIEKLFDPYAQLEGRKARGLSGMGLGLAITDSIIRMMGGKITAESMLGFGSTFKVEIPLVQGDPELADPNAESSQYVIAPEAKILLVDDIDVNLSVGVGFFKLHDIHADIAGSAKDAIKLICEKDYDIVFMDHMMPETDGAKATEIIRSFGGKYEQGKLKIIALTANVTQEARELMLASGMDDFLPKPITQNALNRMLLKWLPDEKHAEERRSINQQLRAGDYTDAIREAEKIEGLNIRQGFRHSGGTAEAFENSMKLLSRRIPKIISALQICLNDGRLSAIAIEAHGMKGALAINGHKELSKLAEGLEFAAKEGDTRVVIKKLPEFTKKLAEFGQQLEIIFSKPTTKKKKPGTQEALAEYIENLMMDVERFDRARAFGEIGRALEYDFGEAADRLLESIKTDLEDYDYDSAMEKLQSFKI